MVTILCASKSTISTHLNHLKDLNKIVYFTKTGDRKKYFIINRDMVFHHIDDMVQKWKEERDIHLELKEYKEKINTIESENEKFDLTFHDDYIKFIDGATSSVEELRNKLTNNKLDI